MKRFTSVRGQFYPAELAELRDMINTWERSVTIAGAVGAIVPHAGYIFSGESAWKALSALDWEHLDRVVVIGPSHRIAFAGISIFRGATYETVGGDHPCDYHFGEQLVEELGLLTVEPAHHEHSTEVQVPLIHQLAPHVPIVECIYGQGADHQLIELISVLRDTPKTGIIVSSDLSHYYTEQQAHELDEFVLEGIKNLNVHTLNNGEACGKSGILALITVCQKRKEKLTVMDYRTSADSDFGDAHRVVGYCSAILTPPH